MNNIESKCSFKIYMQYLGIDLQMWMFIIAETICFVLFCFFEHFEQLEEANWKEEPKFPALFRYINW